MHPELERAVHALRLSGKLPTLESNSNFSDEVVSTCRTTLQKRIPPNNAFDVVALGSIGRGECSKNSDFDYIVVAYGLPEDIALRKQIMSELKSLQKGLTLKDPGRTGVFGRVVSAPDLTEFIGLEDDTNRSLTHRILILGEGVSLYQPEKHKTLVQTMLQRYLSNYKEPKPGVPRFLLNDVLRYWRTLAVDYQAKRWLDLEEEWGLRYLKLLVTRKLAFASLLVPLLACKQATVEAFMEDFGMPSLARIARLCHLAAVFHDPIRTILIISEEFAKALADEGFRELAKKVSSDNRDDWPQAFKDLRNRASIDLQAALETIFFGTELFSRNSKRYLSF